VPLRGPLRPANACSISLADITSITWRRKPIDPAGLFYTENASTLIVRGRPLQLLAQTVRRGASPSPVPGSTSEARAVQIQARPSPFLITG
jgi:hypothetical protein